MQEIDSIGQWVRQRRKLLDLTQAQLAERVGCAVVTIKKIEQETRRPSHAMAELLAAELGLPQAERTRFVALARGQAVARTTDATALPLPTFLQQSTDQHDERRLHRTSAGPFVARQSERAWLHERLATTIANRQPQIVFVRGEAGRGKSALLVAFAAEAQARHDKLIAADGLCTAHVGQGDPLLPFRDLFELLSGDLEARWYGGALAREQAYRLWALLPHTLEAVVQQGNGLIDTLIPLTPLHARLVEYGLLTRFAHEGWATQLAQLAQLAPPLRAQGVMQQQQLFEQVTRVLRTLAAQQPLLLLIDDMQWIDESSLALLFHLSRRLSGSPVLFVGAYRGNEVDDSHPLPATVRELTRRFGAIELDLDTIDQQSSGRPLIDALLDQQPNQLDDAFRAQLLTQTDGHPLFTLELLRYLQENHYLVKDGVKGWVQQQPLVIDALPLRVEAVISQRIRQLGPELQELLTIAAVEGERFTAQLLATTLQRDERHILQRLDHLQKQHGLVQEQSRLQINGRHLNRYQFHHALFQQFFYQRLSTGERQLLHRRVAAELETIYADECADHAVTLAYHLAAAGEEVRSATYRVLAGDRARQQSALVEAVAHYQAALQLWPVTDQAGRAAILSKLGDLLWITGQTNRAMTVLQEALALFTDQYDNVQAGDTLRRMGRLYWELGQLDASWQHYWAALERLEAGPESVELAEAMSSIAQMQMMASQEEQALGWSQRALHLAERLGAEQVVVHALNNLGATLIWREVERGLRLLRESLARAQAANLHYDVCRAHYNLSDTLINLGRYTEAHDEAQALFAYASQIHSVQMMMAGLLKSAESDWRCGRWRRALASLATLDEWRTQETFNPIGKIMADILWATIHNDLRRPEEAYARLTATMTQIRAADEIQLTLPYWGQLMRATIARHIATETINLIDKVVALLARTPASFGDAGETLLTAYRWVVAQRPQKATGSSDIKAADLDALTATLWQQLTDFIKRSPAIMVPAIRSEASGIRALYEQNLPTALAHLQAAAAQWAEANRPYEQRRVLQIYADLLQQRGNPDGAATTMAAAEVVARQLLQELGGSEFAGSTP
ncbi:MAG: AAA family ATPase [Caldilineaceae bacterium]